MDDRRRQPGEGHYRALGVPGNSPQKGIELAFERWREARRRGRVGEREFLAAERAYHALADPTGRLRHDRQLGLHSHPAWGAADPRAARRLTRRGLRALALGHPRQSLRLFGAALARGEPAAAAWHALAAVRAGGCPHGASRRAAAAVELFPRDAAMRFALAEALRAAGGGARALREERRGWGLILRATLSAALPGGRRVRKSASTGL